MSNELNTLRSTRKQEYGWWKQHEVIDALPLTDKAHRLYCHYCALENKQATERISPESLSTALTVTAIMAALRWGRREHVIEARKELIAFGLITFTGRTNGSHTDINTDSIIDRNNAYYNSGTDPMISNPPVIDGPPSGGMSMEDKGRISRNRATNQSKAISRTVATSHPSTVATNCNGEDHGINRKDIKDFADQGANAPKGNTSLEETDRQKADRLILSSLSKTDQKKFKQALTDAVRLATSRHGVTCSMAGEKGLRTIERAIDMLVEANATPETVGPVIEAHIQSLKTSLPNTTFWKFTNAPEVWLDAQAVLAASVKGPTMIWVRTPDGSMAQVPAEKRAAAIAKGYEVVNG